LLLSLLLLLLLLIINFLLLSSDDTNAKLIGVEFHITEKLFDGLPADEKRLWHSHAYEVKSGAMLAPRLPDSAEKELMKQMAFTYGKAWSFWDTVKGKWRKNNEYACSLRELFFLPLFFTQTQDSPLSMY
jgi:hypothetical protein